LAMRKPTKSTLVGATAVAIAIGIAATGFARAEETATPTPIETIVETPVETVAPVVPEPTEEPAPEPTEDPTTEPTPEPEVKLPIATTVIGAVTVALSTYCSAPAGTALNQSNWNVSDANEVNVNGYWEVWANSPRGLLFLTVTPTDRTAIVASASDVASAAFAAWGCPAEMTVGRL
jgi:hypothetical protein